MPALDIDRHLEEQIAADDPWNLDANPFEARRYAAIRALLEPLAPLGDALEIGCAAGAFSLHLAALSRRVHLVDRMPAALDRAAARIGAATGLSWEVADIGHAPIVDRRFDAIVAAEVLYFLP
ncbi:SAM-dependent methyltransferase, partial [Lysobacter xanthus]